MKKFLFVFILLGQVMCFALTREEACRLKTEKSNEMDIISANIANINTTRTPEGGPYLPDHVDAQGYVKFPDINLETEMANMIFATRAYEKAERNCE